MRKFEQNIAGLGKDKYLLLETSELAEYAQRVPSYEFSSWSGGSHADFMRKIVTGDESLVADSETFLAKLEDQVPMSRGWRNFDDVVGAVPNIPAFLAGHPQCMRRRERTMRDTSPLAIYMDLTSSAGISASRVQKRGVVLLALTRMLVEHRPVELWVGSSLGGYGRREGLSGTVAWKIDTTPLDLARAAFHISATSMSRGFGYSLCKKELGTEGNWPFNNYSRHCETAKQRLAAVLPGQDILYIEPIMLGDPLTDDPVGWLKRTIASYVKSDE